MKHFFPMNPKEIKDIEKLQALIKNPKWCIQLKKDGVRGELYITSTGNRIFGRNCGVKSPFPLELTHNLPTIARWKFPKHFHGITFDVEIYMPGKTAAEISGAINPNRVEPPVKYEPQIEFWCFDIPLYKEQENPFTQGERIKMYEALFKPYRNNLNLLHTLRCIETLYENKSQYLSKWLESGEEGGVLKNLDSLYLYSYEKEGKRSADTWVKCKKGFEDDYVICGFSPPEHYYKGDKLSTWKYWETPEEYFYEGPRKNPQDKAITKFHYHGWIGALSYGIGVNPKELDKHCKKHGVIIPTIEARETTFAILGTVSGINDSLREKISQNPIKYLYQVIKISGMEQYPDTLAIRHPNLKEVRWDKNAENCIFKFKNKTM